MFGMGTTIRFLASKFISTLGNASAAVVLPLVLLAITGDPLAAGTLALACGVPQFLAGIFGGALLDRFNRRNVSVISDFISAACVAALPIVEMTAGLNLGWFILFGVLGAIGDIPGMTARSVLLPSVTERDGLDLQRFVGISQAMDSLAVIVGPALAAVLIGTIGGIPAFWVTAGLSLCAALITLSLPRSIGTIKVDETPVVSDTTTGSLLSSTLASLKVGIKVMFRTDGIITAAILLSTAMTMVIGSYQGLVLPVYFTELNQPERLGYVLSALSLGLLIGPLVYAALTEKLKRRTWFLISMVGMVLGMGIMAALPAYPVLLFGAFFAGLTCGPFSALLGFLVLDKVPEENRGAVFGFQNSFLLVASPLAVFGSSILVTILGTQFASWVLFGFWVLMTIVALNNRSMKRLDEEEHQQNQSVHEAAISE
ncbi:MAG: MFS transporter [Raoultibacter sp.]|jgi:MFS family permease